MNTDSMTLDYDSRQMSYDLGSRTFSLEASRHRLHVTPREVIIRNPRTGAKRHFHRILTHYGRDQDVTHWEFVCRDYMPEHELRQEATLLIFND